MYTEEWPPLNFTGPEGAVIGDATQTVKGLLDNANITYDLRLVTWNRAYNKALSTPNTLLFTLLKTPKRENLFHWFCPIAQPQKIGLFRLTTAKKLQIDTLQDAKKSVLGVIRGDYPSVYLQTQGFIENENLIFSSNEEANLRLLISGRVDLVVQTKQALHSRLRHMGYPPETVTSVFPSIDGKDLEACLVLNKLSDSNLVRRLRKATEAIHENLE